MASLGIIDYGMGNLHSLAKAFERVAPATVLRVTADPVALMACDRLVLPGVGGVAACMTELCRLELDQLLHQAVRSKPLLGVCLGMQVLLDRSDENGGIDTLGLIPGRVQRFADPLPQATTPSVPRLKVPHMGWNRVRQSRPHPLWRGVVADSWFYFVHSYYAMPEQPSQMLGSCEYGVVFSAAVVRGNVAGFQFHPEKSQSQGLQLLSNFLEWDGTD